MDGSCCSRWLPAGRWPAVAMRLAVQSPAQHQRRRSRARSRSRGADSAGCRTGARWIGHAAPRSSRPPPMRKPGVRIKGISTSSAGTSAVIREPLAAATPAGPVLEPASTPTCKPVQDDLVIREPAAISPVRPAASSSPSPILRRCRRRWLPRSRTSASLCIPPRRRLLKPWRSTRPTGSRVNAGVNPGVHAGTTGPDLGPQYSPDGIAAPQSPAPTTPRSPAQPASYGAMQPVAERAAAMTSRAHGKSPAGNALRRQGRADPGPAAARPGARHPGTIDRGT